MRHVGFEPTMPEGHGFTGRFPTKGTMTRGDWWDSNPRMGGSQPLVLDHFTTVTTLGLSSLWMRRDSNSRPPLCRRGTLPLSYASKNPTEIAQIPSGEVVRPVRAIPDWYFALCGRHPFAAYMGFEPMIFRSTGGRPLPLDR